VIVRLIINRSLGIGHDIRQAYSFICNNFDDEAGDQIVLIGFSRGAFTARAVAQLIHDVGVLTKKGLYHLPEVYKLWKRQSPEDSTPQDKKSILSRSDPPDEPSPTIPSQSDEPTSSGKSQPSKSPLDQRCRELEGDFLLQRYIQITACAVWDTVAALGPRMLHGIPQPSARKLAFVNSNLCPNIELALHALALDEDRRHFKPLLWKLPDPKLKRKVSDSQITSLLGPTPSRTETVPRPNVLRQC
jgi:hypothetical protein